MYHRFRVLHVFVLCMCALFLNDFFCQSRYQLQRKWMRRIRAPKAISHMHLLLSFHINFEHHFLTSIHRPFAILVQSNVLFSSGWANAFDSFQSLPAIYKYKCKYIMCVYLLYRCYMSISWRVYCSVRQERKQTSASAKSILN